MDDPSTIEEAVGSLPWTAGRPASPSPGCGTGSCGCGSGGADLEDASGLGGVPGRDLEAYPAFDWFPDPPVEASTAATRDQPRSPTCGCRSGKAVERPPIDQGAALGTVKAGPPRNHALPILPFDSGESANADGGCGSGSCGCRSDGSVLSKPVDRRGALSMLFGAAAVGTQALTACSPTTLMAEEEREARLLAWREYIKGNYRRMSERERAETIDRLQRLARLRRGEDVAIRTTDAQPGVLYGYAFNIDKCKGFRNCIQACVEENNLDRNAGTQYIRIFEMERGEIDLDHADATYQHEVPAEGHFYLGTQCFQCANPPCVPVCPVQATWQEPDGIVVVDYDWCIGCRYCVAACPYWARRFNWGEPEVPVEKVNPNQHYLGNRARKKGRSREVHLLHPTNA
jgi:Fe-S-cluster-containing dehydrogenase component